MRKRGRTDNNHQELMDGIRKQMGASVKDISGLGQGTPDLLVGWRGVNYLIEVKDGSKSPSRQALTADERDWHAMWAGAAVIIANSTEDAIGKICVQAKEVAGG